MLSSGGAIPAEDTAAEWVVSKDYSSKASSVDSGRGTSTVTGTCTDTVKKKDNLNKIQKFFKQVKRVFVPNKRKIDWSAGSGNPIDYDGLDDTDMEDAVNEYFTQSENFDEVPANSAKTVIEIRGVGGGRSCGDLCRLGGEERGRRLTSAVHHSTPRLLRRRDPITITNTGTVKVSVPCAGR